MTPSLPPNPEPPTVADGDAATAAMTTASRSWLSVYVIVKHPGRPAYWLTVGTAFVNRDGSLNVRLNANPIDGQLHIRPAATRPAASRLSATDATADHGASLPTSAGPRVRRGSGRRRDTDGLVPSGGLR